ncbi:MAG: immunoglobulin-like domain-containing protein [Ignavibacteriales bacterium]
MKRNAFTLIELLGVISILGLIVLIALPAVEKNIKNSKQKLYETQISNIESSLKEWATDNLSYLPSEDGEIITLTLYQLKQGGYVNKGILNPLTDELFPNDMLVTITKKLNTFEYEVLVNTGTRTGTAVINPDAPVLIINGSPMQRVEIFDVYTDPGVIALDSEGNLIAQSNVITTISGSGSSISTSAFGTYTVKYQVTDPDNGYKTTVTRTVTVSDKTKPSLVVPGNIVLAPAEALTFNARTGATATDNYDGDLTSQIEIMGDLSIIPGTYYLTYKVTDSSNNTTSKKRTITVGSTYVNAPELATGMTPIVWDGSSWKNTTADDPNWYNYDSKKWANAKTADGSFWVWIPRFIYKISSGWHTNTAGTIDIQFTKNTNDNWNSSVIGSIDTGTTANASNNKWTNHPAFTFGTTELTGIWVAKFEATAASGVASNGYGCVAADDVTTKTVKIIPNASPWICLKIGNAFTVSRNMETNSTYGWGTSGTEIDTHLIKNIEWGAVAYLAQSTYGKNGEVWINDSEPVTTGCASNSANDSIGGCRNTYETTNGVNASTTGTIYGIYDMSGGTFEYVAAYVDNASSSLNTYGSSIINANVKYKDIYSKGSSADENENYSLTISHKGDAIYETSNFGPTGCGECSWFTGESVMPGLNNPWFTRGHYWEEGYLADTFAFGPTGGNVDYYSSFRPVLIITPPPAITYLYNEGVNSSAWVVGSATSSAYVTVTRTKEATDLLTTVSSSDDYTVGSATWVTDNPVDLTDYSTLKIDSSQSGSCNYMNLIISASKTVAQPDEPKITINCGTYPSGSRNITSLDISSMNGNFYIKYVLNVRGLENGTTKLYKVWLEP